MSDDGRWVDPTPSVLAAGLTPDRRLRGLGLPLVAQLVDGLEVRCEPHTRVEIRHRLRRPAGIVQLDAQAGAPVAPHGTRVAFGTRIDPETAGLIHVRGPVTLTTAGALRSVLDLESRAATRTVTLELTGVTHLASAGVRVLQGHLVRAHRNGARLVLRAASGTPASAILDLVGVPVAE